MTDTPSDKLLRDFQAKLNDHFALSPVRPEHRLTEETKDRFTSLLKEEDWKQAVEDRLVAIEARLAKIERR